MWFESSNHSSTPYLWKYSFGAALLAVGVNTFIHRVTQTVWGHHALCSVALLQTNECSNKLTRVGSPQHKNTSHVHLITSVVAALALGVDKSGLGRRKCRCCLNRWRVALNIRHQCAELCPRHGEVESSMCEHAGETARTAALQTPVP
jgi:hypothetical protein